MLARTRPVGLALTLAASLAAGAAAAEPGGRVPVALELVLAVDASGSVHAGEFALQIDGLAAAFRDPEVVAAIEAQGELGIAVALMQWSSQGQQVIAIDWTRIGDPPSVAALADRIEATVRLIEGETGLAPAIAFAWRMLENNAFEGRRRVIDVSGDGSANVGPDPDAVRDGAAAVGITINGLAILNEQPDLGDYYRDHVIGGPGAFVLEARDYDDFARAMRTKLLEEIQSGPVAAIPERPGTGLASLNAGAEQPQ